MAKSRRHTELFDTPSPATSLVIGRFNVPTTAHAHTLERAALSSGGPLAVGIISSNLWSLDFDPDEHTRDYIADANEQHRKTSFTPEERRSMLNLTIADTGLYLAQVVEIGRPELSPSRFTRTFPPDEYDLCFPAPRSERNAGFDEHRDQALPKILERRVVPVVTDITHHNSDIKRRAVAEGDHVWSEYMTPRAYDYFRDIKGPDRLRQHENTLSD